MISLAMQLGYAALPAKTVSGRKHIPDGYSESRPGGSVADVFRKAADRRDLIVRELALSGPMTAGEIVELTGANKNTSNEDMKVLLKSERVKKRQHKGDNIYWAVK
jgi:predicted HTH transcriptional regulator